MIRGKIGQIDLVAPRDMLREILDFQLQLCLPHFLLAPHALAWTDEMALGNGRSAIRAILAVRDGRVPQYLANPAVPMAALTPCCKSWTAARSSAPSSSGL